jgi:hypothetical protein
MDSRKEVSSNTKMQVISKTVKTKEELAYEEYLRDLELAIENH